MLIKFTVGNFKSFKDKATLDMQAASISKPDDGHVIDAGKFKLLKSVAIYGPNASGKSKLLQAIEFMRDFVIDSSKNTQANELINVDPFRLSTDTRKHPSHFEVEFLLGGICYRYGFETTPEKITKEWLFYRPNNITEKPLFVRMEDEIEIVPSKFKEGKGVEPRTRSNALFLSTVAQWNGELSIRILEWFDGINFFDSVWESDDNSVTMALFVQEKYIGIITSLLQIADLGISGISNIEYTDAIDRKTGIQISLPGTYEHLVTSHKVYDNENNEVETTSFEIEEDESTGTRKFFNIFGKILTTIENGSILFFDEINANFHPRLVQAIILLFNSKKANSNNAQFIFTTHDTNLIDSNFLSRDQIYFLEKNKYGASRLYSLVEFKTRKEDNHEREYFEGRYGAIPFIQNLEKAFEKIENGKTEQTTKAT